MAQFPPAYSYSMRNEDPLYRYACVTDNNGAGVISGINAAAWPEDFARIKAIPQTQRGPFIASFYQDKIFVGLLHLEEMASQDLANRVHDFAVNDGARPDLKVLQQAINECGGNVEVDGIMGPRTLLAANACDQAALLAAFRKLRDQHYRDVAAKNPADAPYLHVWLARDPLNIQGSSISQAQPMEAESTAQPAP